MTKLKNKLWILLAGAAVFSAVFLFAGFTGGEPVSAEEVCTHEYGEGIIHAPTCTAEGYTEYICTLCGESYRDNYTERAEHTYSEVVIEPTCTHEGYTTHFCTVCGYEYTDSYTAATGHTYQETTTLPTCTEEGYTTHTCLECGYSFNDTYVAALGHSYETEVIAPTCTEDGYTVYTCTVCEYTQIGDETAATGHAYALNTVNATCVTYGYTEHICANCSDRFVTDYIAALGHDYEDEVIPAEDGKIGYTKHTCLRCDYSYLSDFVTSGDDGYIGEDEHTHAYIFQMENNEARKCLLISYICECGKAYDGEMVILFTDAEGIGTVLELAADGTAGYSTLNGTYRVTITDAEGELLADFELTNGEPEDHAHAYVIELEDNADERYFTIRYVCECGEAYPGVLYISYTAENGETGTLTANEDGIVDYSMLEGACHILIETEAEVLYELDLPAVQPPEEHTHAFVLNVSDNTEEKYFSLRYVCECGEVYAGTLQMTYTNEYGETGTLAIDAEGKADYSALEAGTYRIMVSTDTEQISEFELHIAQSPSEPDDGKDEQPPIPDEGTSDNEQDKPGNEDGGQAEDKGNTPTLAVLFVLLGALAACGIAVVIAKKRKNKTEQK